MKWIVLVVTFGCMVGFGAANTGAAKYGVRPPPVTPAPLIRGSGSNSIDKCGCHQIVAKLKKVESNLLKLILNLRNKYGAVYSELLDMKKNVKSVSWYVGQTSATGDSMNDQLVGASMNLSQIMQYIRDLTISQQSLVTKTFLTESLLDLEGRPAGSGPPPVGPESDIVYTSCDDVRITETGTYIVQDAFEKPAKVICVLDLGPGAYTVFQNRQDGSTDFYHAFKEYKAGFGDFDGGDYWLGLDNIYRMTNSGDYELFIVLEDFEKNVTYARYDNFAIGSGSDFYPITKLDGYSGAAGDSLSGVVGVLFSTFDLDLDNSESNCAVTDRGAWWYTDCGMSNLNGLYLKGLSGGTTGMFWETFRGANYSLKKSRMMVKRKQDTTTTASTTTVSTTTDTSAASMSTDSTSTDSSSTDTTTSTTTATTSTEAVTTDMPTTMP
ncbi:microfibril-associated glycoprotein 4-like [Anopheles bellator]|uniref:microfibril-associated glycoprotein 4-like n=1 Tax=Anopheles bellator TaxID=139047 RepID=UPI002647115F|nr:microfibril-associated glycoprotein 4-like [Anopheles bellator]